MNDRLSVLLQSLLPKRALTIAVGALAGTRGGALTHLAVRRFIARYGVDMSEAAEPSIERYASFNQFFTRALKAGARPLADAPWVCPVDGSISQFGAIAGDRIFQAKGHDYTTRALVGGDAALAAQFDDGAFATLYLSPKDYHRIHMPCGGRLRRMIHVPGALYSVNPATARTLPGIFARNERVVCVFESAHGPFVMVLVGATIVGSMATTWHGVVNPPRPRVVREWHYAADDVTLARGAEMGRFLLGSTVVMLFPHGKLRFNPAWAPQRAIRMGEAMGVSLEQRATRIRPSSQELATHVWALTRRHPWVASRPEKDCMHCFRACAPIQGAGSVHELRSILVPSPIVSINMLFNKYFLDSPECPLEAWHNLCNA